MCMGLSSIVMNNDPQRAYDYYMDSLLQKGPNNLSKIDSKKLLISDRQSLQGLLITENYLAGPQNKKPYTVDELFGSDVTNRNYDVTDHANDVTNRNYDVVNHASDVV